MVVFTCSCTRLPISKYASSTEFKYQREQPSIQFSDKGRAQDFEFRLFEAVPVRKDNKWVIMQIVAAYRDRYYTFACIMDQTYAKNDEILKSQASLFFEDARIYLSEIATDSQPLDQQISVFTDYR